MALVEFAERQLTLKLVYYGPPLSGKTSNLRSLHDRVDRLNRGRLMTIDTRDDRTLFFDLLPIFVRTSSFSFRIKVYAVPGQPLHEATRKIVLAGADGVVFVADSSADQQRANRGAWQSLGANLASHGLERIPVVVQYNKRDLPDAVPLDAVDRFGDPRRVLAEAVATTGVGVVATFFAAVDAAWRYLDGDVGLTRRIGVDAQAFRRSLADHIGGAEPAE